MQNNTPKKAAKQWDTVGFRHHHGIAVPLFSIWTEKSAGIGEYLDLLPLINWCKEIGLDVIQLLPINDTGNGKSPYSAISAFALNPLHLSLSHFPDFQDSSLAKLQNQNNGIVDYTRIAHEKENFLRKMFKLYGQDWLEEDSFIQFKLENPWLSGFAAFKANNNLLETSYHEIVQYLCYQQMKEVKAHAEQKGIFLKGDIPILIAENSADVFLHKELFIRNLTAGAPPDNFSKIGQSWGFPIYDFENQYNNILIWWKERLNVASKLYHLYRLDHVVGLFRIFAIPETKNALEGFFVPEEEEKWLPQGTKILESFLESCPMLPIGEDLGSVPKEIKERLISLGIPGTKVLRWEERPSSSYPKISMTTVSTHDTETLKEWWQNAPEQAKAFCHVNNLPFRKQFDNQTRQELLRLSHKSRSLFHINQFQEYFPEGSILEFDNEEGARINDPFHPKRELNWSIRWRAPLEEILNNEPLKQMVRTAISN